MKVPREAAYSWKTSLRSDLARMQHKVAGKVDELDPRQVNQWGQLWQNHGGAWQQLIKRFLLAVSKDADLALKLESTTKKGLVEDEQPDFLCMTAGCGKFFASKPALDTHQQVAHGKTTPWKDFITTSACPVCEKEFHSIGRIVRHLRKKTLCQEAVLDGQVPRVSQEARAEVDRRDKHERWTAKQSGASVYSGPPVVG